MVKKFFILILLINLLTARENDYFLMDSYFLSHPKEKKKLLEFTKIVKNPPNYKVSQNKPVKIAMVYPGIQISDYWLRSKKSFEKRLKELNIKYILEDHFTKPATVSQQAKYILKAINEDTDYLIFTMDVNKHFKFIESVISKGKPKLILQNITTPLKRWEKMQPFLYVGFDHKQGSLKIADYLIDKFDSKGNYAVLYGSQGYVSKMRGDEFIKYVKDKSDLKLVDAYYTGMDKQKAYDAAKNILKENEDIKFIYCCSTDISHGAAEAVKELDLAGKVLINGWGGGSSELEALKNNEIGLTVMRINDDNGIAMAEAIRLDLEGDKDKVPLIFSGETVLIDKDISPKELEKLTNKAFRYSN